MTSAWAESDAWILLAAIYADRTGRPTLSELFGAADAIYRGIPTKEELEGAFSRLAASGLVTAAGDTVRPTAAGQALYTSANPSTASMSTELERLWHGLQTLPSAPVTSDITVAAETFDDAYERYSRKMDKVVRSLLRKPGSDA